MKKFVSWRRVSTKKQERSGLGLEAQKDIIEYFVEKENGQIIADFSEAYTGKHLEKCVELRRAIEFSKNNDAVLIIAKTDRFRNTIEALQIYDVTPYMGVWIETTLKAILIRMERVTPYMGVWIETQLVENYERVGRVTPYMGVWIETNQLYIDGAPDYVIPYMGVWIETS